VFFVSLSHRRSHWINFFFFLLRAFQAVLNPLGFCPFKFPPLTPHGSAFGVLLFCPAINISPSSSPPLPSVDQFGAGFNIVPIRSICFPSSFYLTGFLTAHSFCLVIEMILHGHLLCFFTFHSFPRIYVFSPPTIGFLRVQLYE